MADFCSKCAPEYNFRVDININLCIFKLKAWSLLRINKEYITDICEGCGMRASRSFRLSDSKEVIQVGGKEDYMPLCRTCRNER